MNQMISEYKKTDSFKTNEDYWKEVRLLMFNNYEDYFNGYKLCKEWIKKTNRLDDSSKYYEWSVRYYLGVACWGMEKYKKALSFLSIAQKYSYDINEISTKTMIGLCYLGLNKKDMALAVYNNCLEICEKQRHTETVLFTKASLLHNIGEVSESELYVYKSIKIYESINSLDQTNIVVTENKINKNYELLFNIYYKKKEYIKASNILNKIKDNKLKYRLKNRMLKQQKVVSIL